MKKIALILFLICTYVASHAQFNYPSLSSNQQLIEEALSGGVCLVEQSYQLKENKSGNLYGRGGKNEFGTNYTIAIKVPGGLYLSDRAVHPWEYDKNYNQYKGNKYTPVISSTRYRIINDTLGYRPLEAAIDVQVKIPKIIYEMKSEDLDANGFVTTSLEEKSSGWMVWVSSEKNADLSRKTGLTYHIYRKEMNVEEKSAIAVEVPQTSREIIGGMYMVPRQTSVGQLTFYVQGILVEENNAWKMVCPFDQPGTEYVTTVETQESEDTSAEELTPVSAKKDGKKGKDKKKK